MTNDNHNQPASTSSAPSITQRAFAFVSGMPSPTKGQLPIKAGHLFITLSEPVEIDGVKQETALLGWCTVNYNRDGIQLEADTKVLRSFVLDDGSLAHVVKLDGEKTIDTGLVATHSLKGADLSSEEFALLVGDGVKVEIMGNELTSPTSTDKKRYEWLQIGTFLRNSNGNYVLRRLDLDEEDAEYIANVLGSRPNERGTVRISLRNKGIGDGIQRMRSKAAAAAPTKSNTKRSTKSSTKVQAKSTGSRRAKAAK